MKNEKIRDLSRFWEEENELGDRPERFPVPDMNKDNRFWQSFWGRFLGGDPAHALRNISAMGTALWIAVSWTYKTGDAVVDNFKQIGVNTQHLTKVDSVLRYDSAKIAEMLPLVHIDHDYLLTETGFQKEWLRRRIQKGWSYSQRNSTEVATRTNE